MMLWIRDTVVKRYIDDNVRLVQFMQELIDYRDYYEAVD